MHLPHRTLGFWCIQVFLLECWYIINEKLIISPLSTLPDKSILLTSVVMLFPSCSAIARTAESRATWRFNPIPTIHFSDQEILGLTHGQAMETTKLEYDRGRGNFQWNNEMRRDQKEHKRRKHFARPTLTLKDDSKSNFYFIMSPNDGFNKFLPITMSAK